MVHFLNGLILFSTIAILGIYNTRGVTYFENYSIKGNNRVVSVAGSRAEIPCVSKPRKTGDKPTLILWYRESFSKPIYSYDARTTSLSDGERWANDTLFGDRAYFVPLSKPHALLIIEPIKATDEGEYFCRLDYEDSPTTTSSINVTVVVYPFPPEIYWNNQLVTGPIGPMHEGTYWRLVCVTRGGKPSPKVTWWREGHQVLSEVQKTAKDETKAILTVIAARNLSMNTFSCHAQVLFEGSPVDQPLVASIIFRIVLPPIAILITGGERSVAADTTLSLRCTSWGSYPPAEVIWWHSGKKFKPFVQSISEGGNSSTAEIKLTVKDVDHGTAFTCRATNPKYNVPPMEKSITLNVTYKPEVTLRVKVASEYVSKAANSSFLERSVVVRQGSHIRLECPVRSNPPPEFIEWIQNGVTIDSGKSAFSLLLENVGHGNSGSYTCAATNEGGIGLSQPFGITVEYAPLCAKGWQKRTQGSEIYQPVTILCRVDALPADDLNFYWSKLNSHNEEVSFDKEQIQTDGATSRLTFTPQNRSDFGQLLCRAKNSAGMQFEPCQVTLVPSSRPDPPFNCSTDYGGVPGSLLLSCLEGFNGGFPQKFTLIAVQRGRLITNITRDFSEWIVHNLEIGKSVTLRIEASNARGSSDVVRLEVLVPVPQIMSDQDKDVRKRALQRPCDPYEAVPVTHLLDVHLLQDGKSSKTRRLELPLIGILVGGGGVMVISLLVVCIYLIVTRNQKPQKQLAQSRKKSSIKKTNSNYSQRDNGYDILPLNRIKKVSDPDVVICIKKGNSRHFPSAKGVDIVPSQSQIEPLIMNGRESVNCNAFEAGSCDTLHVSLRHDQSLCKSTNHTTDSKAQNEENVGEERGQRHSKSQIRNQSIKKRPCGEGDILDHVSNSGSEKRSLTFLSSKLERRSSAPVIHDGTYDFGKGLRHTGRCIACEKCHHCDQIQCYLNETIKSTLSSTFEPCRQLRKSHVQQEVHFTEKQHGLLKMVSIDEASKINAELDSGSKRIKNTYHETHDNIYEETSNFIPNKTNLKENSSSVVEKKSKIWYKSLGGLLRSAKSKHGSPDNDKNFKLNSQTANANQSSTYQKFDGVCSYEFSSTEKLEKTSPRENRNKDKLKVEMEKKSTRYKSEFEDILYISKAELDILLNIEDNKKELYFLEDVSPLKEMLQQKRDCRGSNTNLKPGYYAKRNDGSKLRRKRNKALKDKTERKEDKRENKELKISTNKNHQSSSDLEESYLDVQCLEIPESQTSGWKLRTKSNSIDFTENLRNGALLENSEAKGIMNEKSISDSYRSIDSSESANIKMESAKTDHFIKLRSPKLKTSKQKPKHLSSGIFKSAKDLNESTIIINSTIGSEDYNTDTQWGCQSPRRPSIMGTFVEGGIVSGLIGETERRIEYDMHSDNTRNKQSLRSILKS